MNTATVHSALPKHVAFIMDGNGRWAKQKGWARLEGHKKGAENVRVLLKECLNLGISTATFYAFSSENWRRPEAEITGLFALMRHFFKAEIKALQAQKVRVKFIGDRAPGGKLPSDLVTLMNDIEDKTAQNTAITAVFAINYGARNELTRAATEMYETQTEEAPEIVSYHGDALGEYLDTTQLPDLDLLIRTGGEKRLSNFMLWQVAYTELYFTDIHWPDFSTLCFHEALADFSQRQRRFGSNATHTSTPTMHDDVEVL